MKLKSLALAASVAGLGLAGAAHGDIVLTFPGPHTLGPLEGVVQNVPTVFGQVTGVEISFDYSGSFGVGWVSDTAVTVGVDQWYALYGNPAYLVNGATNIVQIFPLAGLPSNSNPGFYTGTSSTMGSVVYTGQSVDIGFGNTYAFGGATWSDVTLTIHGVVIPAPGALALLGVAGLAGVSRRRRT